MITQAQIDLLSLLSTHDILNCLPDVLDIDIYKHLDEYLQENYLVDENFAGVFIHTESNIMKQSQNDRFELYTDPNSKYSDHQMGYTAALYLEKIQQKVKDAMTDSKRFFGFVHTSKSMWPMIEYGMRYKIYKMVELASKLLRPRITRQSIDNSTTLSTTNKISSFLQDLPPYSFYAEAKITQHQKIKLLLHQVICTESASDTEEKSTLATDQVSIDFDDLYATICESIWILVVDGTLLAHSCELDCANTASNIQSYTHFCEQLSRQLKEIVSIILHKMEFIASLRPSFRLVY